MKPGQIILEQDVKGQCILIRSVKVSDAKDLCDYINTLSNEETYISFQRDVIKLEEEIKMVKDVVQNVSKNHTIFLLLFVNGVLSGVGDIHMSKRGAIKHQGHLGITLKKEVRGKGFGKLLLTKVIAEARTHIQSLELILLTLFSENEIALNMYKKNGFVEYGFLPKGLRRKGKLHDEILMYKNIRSS